MRRFDSEWEARQNEENPNETKNLRRTILYGVDLYWSEPSAQVTLLILFLLSTILMRKAETVFYPLVRKTDNIY